MICLLSGLGQKTTGEPLKDVDGLQDLFILCRKCQVMDF